jgi:hypothetical protein
MRDFRDLNIDEWEISTPMSSLTREIPALMHVQVAWRKTANPFQRPYAAFLAQRLEWRPVLDLTGPVFHVRGTGQYSWDAFRKWDMLAGPFDDLGAAMAAYRLIDGGLS